MDSKNGAPVAASAPAPTPVPPKKTRFVGIHGTCLSAAESIQKVGVRASLAGRAGSGFYLWSFISDDSRAVELGEDWYRDQLECGAYKGERDRQGILLYFSVELVMGEVVNLNSTAHHEAIRSKLERGRGKVNYSQAYSDHLKGISEAREKHGFQLKLVEASVPYPVSTKRRGGSELTPAADAYIILEPGLAELTLFDSRRLG